MIEQLLEKIVIDKLQGALSGIEGIQFVGTWQTASIKAQEEDSTKAVIAVKAYPRSYETPTVPDAQVQIEVSLAVRAEEDYQGADYMNITSLMSDVFQKWQDNYEVPDMDFTVEGKFQTTGFALNGGDCGLDKEAAVWQYTQSFTIYGIIK